MKFRIVPSIIFILTSAAIGVTLALRSPRANERLPQRNQNTDIKQIQKCYPNDYRAPRSILKIEYEGNAYFQIDALLRDSSPTIQSYVPIYFVASRYGQCKKLEVADWMAELAQFMPPSVAIDMKVNYWRQLFDGLTEQEIALNLNEPHVFGAHLEALFFFPEDVEAFKILGYPLGDKATVYKSYQDYESKDPFRAQAKESSKEAEEIRRKRQKQGQ